MNPSLETRLYEISFEGDSYPPVKLREGATLSEHLEVRNSPVLFGCRTGICGTCTIEVTRGLENLHPRTREEEELLEVLAPDQPRCRLACQININADIRLRKASV